MSGLLMDTNILLLLVVGSWDRSKIPLIRRTATFSPADFDLLNDFSGRFQTVITVPPVLTELSNLMGNEFHLVIASTIRKRCVPMQERAPGKAAVLADEVFDRLGFADISVLLAMDEQTTLLTDDVHLYNEALCRGLDAVNFNHLRKFQ